MWGSVRDGDWVKVDTDINLGMLGGTTIKAGTKGVVTGVSTGWITSRADVQFDSGFGTAHANVPTHRLRLIRPNGGVDRFTTRQRRLAAARSALLLFLAWPIIWWAIQYVWINRGFSGITSGFALSIVGSIGDWIIMVISNPVKGIIYLGFLWIVGRLAWR
ncbi:hypothetical protein [Nocardioides sp. T2.26MG-1]|uniref:hypothetical protein n=1 Tax=Nocardioides sp. T2.26MG-1 TaxID=3041166 RepID=UPI0024773B84|nr:hypothetical protein [Nocardioides sp. T2.26MG-1]CAI9413189.1 hypothetical protein HIDPHFAB_01958 [Nocardioides sp. T2.26MG-1]